VTIGANSSAFSQSILLQRSNAAADGTRFPFPYKHLNEKDAMAQRTTNSALGVLSLGLLEDEM
jgi:hypothetical protein